MPLSLAVSFSTEQSTQSGGLRSVRLRQDLAQIADLIELSFDLQGDATGRSAVREMRSLAKSGPLLWALANLEPGVRSMHQGFVWIDPISERLIGNVSIYKVPIKDTLVIASVAVHPEFRRRGIALKMMEAAMALAQQKQATEVWLQTEADNFGAQNLYFKLNFKERRVFQRWQWYPTNSLVIPERRNSSPDITLVSGNDWRQIYEIAQTTRPNHQGGLGWLRPTTKDAFTKTVSEHLMNIIGFQNRQWYIARAWSEPSKIIGAFSLYSTFGTRYHHMEMLVAPEHQGRIEIDLITYAMRQTADTRRGIIIEHPADDKHTLELLPTLDFQHKRSLMHMSWQPQS